MVPLAVTADGRSYAFRSIDHPVLLPLMAGFVADASLAARGRTLGDQTVAITANVDYGDGLEATIRQVFAGADASALAAAFTTALVGYLENSPFGRPALEGMTLELESQEGLRSATLVDAIPESTLVRPGEALEVRLRLRPFQGEEFTRRVLIEIPREVPEGRLDLVVADGSSWSVYDLQMRPARSGSFRDELGLLERLVPPDRVVLALERPDVGVALEGGTLSVPPSLVVQLRSALGPELATTSWGVVRRVVAEMPMAIAAAERIRLMVQSEGWEDR
jgi:hypothetical protein